MHDVKVHIEKHVSSKKLILEHGVNQSAMHDIARFECILYSTHSVIRLEQHAGHRFALTASALADTLSYLRHFTASRQLEIVCAID